MSDTPRTDHLTQHARTMAEVLDECERLERELAEARADLEREIMRLAACGVVALANTPESAKRAREMQDEYRSDSLMAVQSAVDREMHYRAELARAMRVVEAADIYEANLDDDSLCDVREAIREWKAGR